MRTTSATVVVGRDDEVAAVELFLDLLLGGPAGLVFEGEAGIGKTTLWRAGVDAAQHRGCRLLLARPSESEASLSFLGLADLFEEVEDEALAAVPGPQRAELEIALLRTTGNGRRDRVALARGALNLVRTLAVDGPIVIAVDDVQWLDSPSADALRFVFRRLTDERVGLLASQRGEADAAPLEIDRAIAPERLQRKALRPLSLADLVSVVRTQRDVGFTRPTWRAIHRTSGGNPFFALQLADAVAARGRAAPGEELALPGTLAAAVRERLAPLSDDARHALLEVSMLAQPTPSLVEPQKGIAEALAARVLELDGDRLRFTHPLLASAVQADSSPSERRAMHRRLASVVDDPEEQALHLGRGTTEPDEEVAATLEAAADRARWRGLPETAGELAEHAERLTPPGLIEHAARRATEAGRYWNAAGDAVRSREVLSRVTETAPPGEARAGALALLGSVLDDFQALKRALEETQDPELLAVIHADLSEAEIRRGDWTRSVEHARAALDLAERSGDPATLAKALTVMALREAHDSEDRALALLERGAGLEQSLPEPLPITNSPTITRGFVLLGLDRLDEARLALEEAYQRALALGHTWRAIPLTYLAELECRAGDWKRAHAHALEAEELGRQWGLASGEAFTLYGRTLVEAHLGNTAEARNAGARCGQLARETGNTFTLARGEGALGFLELSLSNFEAALERLGPLVGLPGFAPLRASPGYRPAADAVEALLGLGRLDEAKALADEVERRAAARGLPSRVAAAARCRALVLAEYGELDAAREAIGEAHVAHARLAEPFEIARTLLAQGVIERRVEQRAEARQTLERARGIFEQLGARLWVNKASAELARTVGDVEFRLLGPLEVRVGERVRGLGGAKQRAVLACLLLHANEVVSSDRLIDELWGERPPKTAQTTLQVYVSRLRKALPAGALERREPGYLVALEPEQLDLHRCEALLHEGRKALEAGDPQDAFERLQEALGLWRGPPLADFAFASFAQAAIGRLEELRLACLEERIEAELALGRHPELVGELEELIAQQPLRERLHGQRMLALYRCGRQADALAAYQQARTLLVEQLGIEPSPALQKLEHRVLTQDATLEWTPPAAPERPAANVRAPQPR